MTNTHTHKFNLTIINYNYYNFRYQITQITAINFTFELSIKTRPLCLYGLEKKQTVIDTESYRPSCSVSTEFITHMIRTAFAI